MRFSTKYKRRFKINNIFDLGLYIKPLKHLRIKPTHNPVQMTIPIRISNSGTSSTYDNDR